MSSLLEAREYENREDLPRGSGQEFKRSSSELESAQIKLRAGSAEIFLDCTPAQVFAIPGLVACMRIRKACCRCRAIWGPG